MQKLKENRGITLIALVITIIVLLILAGITIAQLGESGLFKKTQTAKETYTFEAAQEQLELKISELQMERYATGESFPTLNELKTYLEDPKFEGEYIVEISYEPLAAEETQIVAYYAKVTHVPTKFVFYVDGKMVVVGGESNAKEKIELSSIEITTPPTKTTYTKGENLDLTGVVITATYSNGKTEVIDSEITFSPEDGTVLSAEGQISITASYTKDKITKTGTISVNVNELYSANRVPITILQDTTRGGTIEVSNGEYTLSGQAMLKSQETITLTRGTFYVEVKDLTRYYTSSYSDDYVFAGLIIGTGSAGGGNQSYCFGISDGWDGQVIRGFTGTGGYPTYNKSDLSSGWNRFAVTYDGSTFKMYLNGVLKGTNGSGEIEQTKLFIGGYNEAPFNSAGTNWGFANGIYRNIKVYDAALPASEL